MTEIPIEPKLFWGLFYLFCFGLAVVLVYALLSTRQPASEDPLDKLKSKFGASSIHDGLFLCAVLLWAAIALSLTVGLLGMIWELIWYAFPTGADVPAAVQKEQTMELRIALVRLTAFTATLGAVIALPFTIIRLRLTSEQNQTAAEGLITDRLSKAVEGLGAVKTVKRQRKNNSGALLYENNNETEELDFKRPIMEEVTEPNLEVRAGAIYALERIAQDSERDHIQIMEILCTYVRQNAPAFDTEPTKNLVERPRPRIDIQTSISVIGRRSSERILMEAQQEYHLDLRNCDLSGVDFKARDYSAAMFHDCRMEAAIFRDAKLHGTEFYRTLLNFCDFSTASMKGARLDNVIFNTPKNTLFHFINTELLGVSLCGADLSGVRSIKLDACIGTSDTKLHSRYQEKLDAIDIEQMDYDIEDARDSEDAIKLNELQSKLRKSSFGNWCCYSSDDMAMGEILQDFWKKYELLGFPFHGKK